MRYFLFFISFVITFFLSCSSFAENITLTTYYPAPEGRYEEMRAKRMAVGDTYVDPSVVDTIPDGSLVVEGNVGIGTSAPLETVHIKDVDPTRRPSVRIEADGGNLASFKAYGSNAGLGELNGNAGFGGSNSVYIFTDGTVMSGGTHSLNFMTGGADAATQVRMKIISNGNVGIGSTNPGVKLDVNGQIAIRGGTPGAGKVLTSDASGKASWATPAGGGACRAVSGAPGFGGSAAYCAANEHVTGGGGYCDMSVQYGFLHYSWISGNGWAVDCFGLGGATDVPATAVAICCPN